MDKVDALNLLIGFLTEDEYNRLLKKVLKEASSKTPSVSKNEAQEKDCNSCEHRWMPITDCCRCDSLNGYMYWQQSD